MSFPRYPAYKDSGVEWLGRIPSQEVSGLDDRSQHPLLVAPDVKIDDWSRRPAR